MISPLLANVYLHYTFDLWAERWRRREATGDMIIVRYADDIIVGFEHEADARRFWDAMRERLQEFSLSLNSEKSRLIEFGRHAADRRARRGLGKPETFNFLGFPHLRQISRGGDLQLLGAHICGKSRWGKFQIAETIAKQVPAFSLYVPPERKPWMSEDPRMGIFRRCGLGMEVFLRPGRPSLTGHRGHGSTCSRLRGKRRSGMP